ncbi:MAG TPA: MarR family winged helix-turn-helix transcriptional regulator [Acetobacteraceae bacterium]|nr:MarR family winged helix-turn-helix transcriptional regulator [Acetobacteraceae bacterium]
MKPPARQRPPHRGIGSERRDAAADEVFPPLTTSLAAFVKDGSDREFRRLIYSFVSLTGFMEANRDYFAAFIGVSSPQLLMMGVIGETPGASVSAIADRLGVSTQFVTTEIGKLIAKDLVSKRSNEADRRGVLLSLTPKGETLLRELGSVRRKINDMTFRSLTEARATALQEILDDLIRDARSAVHELDAPDMRGKKAPTALTNVAQPAGKGRPDGKAAPMRRRSSATNAG